ncbi:hypothetical protein K440DRAFT_660168 [Wilcoxina mikolae CBS 423.85]|nr:hypothetical protein K440DRAFT_660168 [Wilcoxina mikolae CBS 423.85]
MSQQSRPNTQPANLSLIVRANPPPSLLSITDTFEYTVALRQVVFGAARFLSEEFQFEVLQDRSGNVWVQKADHMVVPVGGRRVLVNSLEYDQPLDWLHLILNQVRMQCRSTIPPNVPYTVGVLAIYEGVNPTSLLPSMIPIYLQTGPQSANLRLKPVNAWMVYRSWFVDGLKHTYIIGQSDISRLARVCYGNGKNKDWVNIAHMYTHARNNSLLGGISLPEFVKRELKNYGFLKKPIHLLRAHGIDMSMFPRRPGAPTDEEEGLKSISYVPKDTSSSTVVAA